MAGQSTGSAESFSEVNSGVGSLSEAGCRSQGNVSGSVGVLGGTAERCVLFFGWLS